MKLKKLLKDIPVKAIKGSKEIEITGITANSKLVSPGNLFIAKRGRIDDGNRYIPDAIEAGATAVLTDIYDPSLTITQVIAENPAAIEGALVAQYHEFPSDKLLMVGITGTNGKTTTSFLVKHLLDGTLGTCGLIGTIEYIIGAHRYQATRTTPDVASNHKMLKEMVMQGCKAAVMEVTSHALDQGRADSIEYDIALFTNLTLDHLDYHVTMEAYATAKNRLFRNLSKKPRKTFPKLAIVNADSPWNQKLLEGCTTKVLTYGIESPADFRAKDILLTPSGTNFTLLYLGKEYHVRFPLVGRYNVYNCLAALAVVRNDLEKAIERLKSFPPVPGRLEAVPNALGRKIYVDFAHSDDALANVLDCLREFKTGRIITVFGCGGDRDKSKRPKMARVCEEGSDICIVTSDNPRTEDPNQIASEIVKGFKEPSRHIVELDRRLAIGRAIALAQPEDLILIAGKGHETYQVFSHKTIEFDDRKVAAELAQVNA